MRLSRKACYALHVLSQKTVMSDLFGFPVVGGMVERQSLLEQGMIELKERGLLGPGNLPEQEALAIGTYLTLYQEAPLHCQIGETDYCALQIDTNGWYHIRLQQVDEETMEITRQPATMILAQLMQEYPFLGAIDQQPAVDQTEDWQPYASFRWQTYYKAAPQLRLRLFDHGRVVRDETFAATPSGLYCFDGDRERIRTMSRKDVKAAILDILKVEVTNGPKN